MLGNAAASPRKLDEVQLDQVPAPRVDAACDDKKVNLPGYESTTVWLCGEHSNQRMSWGEDRRHGARHARGLLYVVYDVRLKMAGQCACFAAQSRPARPSTGACAAGPRSHSEPITEGAPSSEPQRQHE